MRSFRERLTTDDGFTLVEMMVAMTLFLIIAGAALTALNSGANAERGQQARHDAMLELRPAMTKMTKELRQAVKIDAATSTSSFLSMDTLINGQVKSVVYKQVTVGGDLQLQRVIGTTTQVLVTHMSPTDPVFCYSYDSTTFSCIATTPPPITTAIRLTFSKDPEFDPAAPVTLATDIQLRNI